jgi:hypothetical protein
MTAGIFPAVCPLFLKRWIGISRDLFVFFITPVQNPRRFTYQFIRFPTKDRFHRMVGKNDPAILQADNGMGY